MTTLNNLYAKLMTLWHWMKVTTLIVFMPVTVLAVLIGTQTAVFTGVCYTTGYACPYALSSDKLVAMYAGAMMSLQGSDEYTVNDKRRAAR